jgi:hypothetical protein
VQLIYEKNRGWKSRDTVSLKLHTKLINRIGKDIKIWNSGKCDCNGYTVLCIFKNLFMFSTSVRDRAIIGTEPHRVKIPPLSPRKVYWRICYRFLKQPLVKILFKFDRSGTNWNKFCFLVHKIMKRAFESKCRQYIISWTEGCTMQVE